MDKRTIAKRIDYQFTDESLLEAAFTTKPYSHEEYQKRPDPERSNPPLEHYEMLSTLGDAVLNLALVDIFRERGLSDSGDLSICKSKLANTETQIDVWKEFTIDYHSLNITKNDVHQIEEQGALEIIERFFEGLIGAIFLDSNYPVTKDIIRMWYNERIDQCVNATKEN